MENNFNNQLNKSFRLSLSHHDVCFLETLLWRELKFLHSAMKFHIDNSENSLACHRYDEILQIISILKYLRRRRDKIFLTSHYET